LNVSIGIISSLGIDFLNGSIGIISSLGTDFLDVSINLTDEEIVQMSKNRFKNLVDKKINLFAFQYLKRKAESHSKSMNILNEAKDNNMNKQKKVFKGKYFS
jgi:hypothetical protein